MRYERVENTEVRAITTYLVISGDGVDIGYVWSVEGFSYYGMNGWNSGIRIRDYHPIEWHYRSMNGKKVSRKIGFQTRRRAAIELASEVGAYT